MEAPTRVEEGESDAVLSSGVTDGRPNGKRRRIEPEGEGEDCVTAVPHSDCAQMHTSDSPTHTSTPPQFAVVVGDVNTMGNSEDADPVGPESSDDEGDSGGALHMMMSLREQVSTSEFFTLDNPHIFSPDLYLC